MHHFKVFLAILLISYSSNAAHKDNFCSVSKITLNDYEPANFHQSNNLLKKAGQDAIISGERIIIYGKVLDQNCLPVSDAKVYIWQVNGHGKYPYVPLRNIANNEFIDKNNHTTFTGNGTATTNNKGEFIFLTIMPTSIHDLKPHINIRAQHYIFKDIQTRFVLNEGKIMEFDDKEAVSIIKQYTGAENIPVYGFEITMPGVGLKKYTE